MRATCYSLIVPVYRNEDTIEKMLNVVEALTTRLEGKLELVVVVDGSPDRSYPLLRQGLAARSLRATLIGLSRNFGSFAAIRHGLGVAQGPWFAVMAADPRRFIFSKAEGGRATSPATPRNNPLSPTPHCAETSPGDRTTPTTGLDGLNRHNRTEKCGSEEAVFLLVPLRGLDLRDTVSPCLDPQVRALWPIFPGPWECEPCASHLGSTA